MSVAVAALGRLGIAWLEREGHQQDSDGKGQPPSSS
jgi:hypothetical protein